MDKIKNVPDVVRLDGEAVFHLSISCALVNAFPAELRELARFKLHQLHHPLRTREIRTYSLVSAAYVGLALLPVSYGRFIVEADRINKLELNPLEFLKNEVARENSAAEEFGMSRGEIKRLLAHLDETAMKFGDISSYAAVFNCRNEILKDQSPFAPADRETYAKGPLYLWDFAKAVNEQKLSDMAFGTFGDWVLFVHAKNGVAFGHAIHTFAHRFGNFSDNPLIDGFELRTRGDELSPIIDVPRKIQETVKAFAEQRFPDHLFEFIPPPMVWDGTVIPTKMVHPDERRLWSEV